MAKRGGPKKTLDDLPDDWYIQLMVQASEGESQVQWRLRALGGLHQQTYERMCREEPEFAEAINYAMALQEDWWLKEGIKLMRGFYEKAVPAVWIFNMKNRFKWTDKQELTGPEGRDLIPEGNSAESDIRTAARIAAIFEQARKRRAEQADSAESDGPQDLDPDPGSPD